MKAVGSRESMIELYRFGREIVDTEQTVVRVRSSGPFYRGHKDTQKVNSGLIDKNLTQELKNRR